MAVDGPQMVADLIAAIEAALLQQGTVAVDASALASNALQKLQFDFPACSISELQALSEELSRAPPSTRTPRHVLLSCKIVANIVAGAAVSVGPAKNDGIKLTSGSSSSDHHQAEQPAVTPSTPADGTLDQANLSLTAPHLMQQAYLQLAAAMFISLVSQAVAQPEDGWQQLHQLSTQTYDSLLQQHSTPSGSSTLTLGPATSNPVAPSSAATLGQNSIPAPPTRIHHPSMEAEESDDDDFMFEDIMPSFPHPHPHLLHPFQHSSLAPQHNSAPLDTCPPYSADALLRSLLWLSGNVSYSLLGAAAVFTRQDSPSTFQHRNVPAPGTTQPQSSQASSTPSASATLSPALLQLLSACVSAPFELSSLLPLLQPYVTLIADATAEHPQCTMSLNQVWPILAPSGTASDLSPSIRPRQPTQQQQQPALMQQTFPGLALELASGLSARLIPTAAKSELWRQLHAQLLPPLLTHLQLLTRSTARLSTTTPSPTIPLTADIQNGAASPSPEGTASSQEWSTALEAIQQACPLVSFYLRQAPRNAQPSQQLLDAGLIAPVSLLWIRFGFLPPAEQLRLAALLAAAGSPAVLRWMLAVPGFVPALGCNTMSEGGVAEEHGCIWQLLLSDLSGSAPPNKGSSLTAADALAITGRPDRAERLLQAAAAAAVAEQTAAAAALDTSPPVSDIDSKVGNGQHPGAELAAAHTLLQLLACTCELSPRTASMLTVPLAPALRELESALRSSHSSCQPTPAPTQESTTPSSSAARSLDVSDDARGAASGQGLGEGRGSQVQQIGLPVLDELREAALKDHESEEGVQASRHSKGMLQLRSSAMKLIKTLLTSQGKTD